MYFGEFINNRRKELNMSIDELVKKSSVPKGTLSKITAGINTNPTLSTIRALCKALNCTMDDALDFEKESTLSTKETEMVKKYRSLDDYGKDMVNTVLEKELTRTIEQRERSANVIELNLIDAPVPAGLGDMLEDYENSEKVFVPLTSESRRADYLLKIYGDSMEPKFSDGDYILIRQQPTVDEGQIGIFGHDGKGYVKKFGGDRLISLNKKYPGIYIDESTRCFGLVLGTTYIVD